MSKELKELDEKRVAAETELKEMEKFIYRLETNYFRDSTIEGNILKGWEGLINLKSSKTSAYPSKKQTTRSVLDKERVFSGSSSTLPSRIGEYENPEVVLPYKRKPPTISKTSKRPIKRNKESDTDDYSEGLE